MTEHNISTQDELRDAYGHANPKGLAVRCILPQIDDHHRAFISYSPFDKAAVSYTAFIAGLYAFMNRIVDGHGIRADDAAIETGGSRLTELGYSGIAKMLAGQRD